MDDAIKNSIICTGCERPTSGRAAKACGGCQLGVTSMGRRCGERCKRDGYQPETMSHIDPITPSRTAQNSGVAMFVLRVDGVAEDAGYEHDAEGCNPCCSDSPAEGEGVL